METFSALLAFCEGNLPVTGDFPSKRPVTLSYDFSFDLRLNKRLSKPSRRRWFEKPSRSFWRHCNDNLKDSVRRTLIDHGREGVTATTPEWFLVRRRDVPRTQLEGRSHRTTNHEGVVAVTPDRPWSIPIITWLNNVILHVFTTTNVQNHHQIKRRRLLASIVTSRISP